jgi:hypothetical protein
MRINARALKSIHRTGMGDEKDAERKGEEEHFSPLFSREGKDFSHLFSGEGKDFSPLFSGEGKDFSHLFSIPFVGRFIFGGLIVILSV